MTSRSFCLTTSANGRVWSWRKLERSARSAGCLRDRPWCRSSAPRRAWRVEGSLHPRLRRDDAIARSATAAVASREDLDLAQCFAEVARGLSSDFLRKMLVWMKKMSVWTRKTAVRRVRPARWACETRETDAPRVTCGSGAAMSGETQTLSVLCSASSGSDATVVAWRRSSSAWRSPVGSGRVPMCASRFARR
jgi:hypothetical protein